MDYLRQYRWFFLTYACRDGFVGDDAVKGIADDIVSEFQSRYNGQYPVDVEHAQYFIPENVRGGAGNVPV